MPDITAFRGIRYDLGHVGSLSDVVAPPYDVIDPELQQQLYDRHPHNVTRLILGTDESSDDEYNNRYTRAARYMKQWLRDGLLFSEAQPAVYVYHQKFTTEDGIEHTRRGFMCRVKIEPFGTGDIHPHEETHGGAKADRLKLWQHCRANMSQIFGLFPDDANEAQSLLDTQVMGETPLTATDHLGVESTLWPVTHSETIATLQQVMSDKAIYIADGHHRYETACAYRDAVAAEQGGTLPADHPANYVLMMCVSMSDPGMLVLPTHRLFRGLPAMTSQQLTAKLGDFFDCEPAGNGPERSLELWPEIELEGEQSTLGFYTTEDGTWTLCRLTDAGRAKMAEVASEQSADWQSLGVSILHRLVIDNLLEGGDLPAPKYARKLSEIPHDLKTGDTAGRDLTGQEGSGDRFELAALVMPATLDHIRAISHAGERMPAKSTYFYPKVLSGLLFNPLE